MNLQVIKFNKEDQPEFVKEVRKKVNKHFEANNISKHANLNMKFKTVFMLGLYFGPLILMLSGVISSLWPVMLMWVLMGFGMAGIGLSIMHDANHRSYSKNLRVNKILGFLVNFLGAYHENWKIQHNVLHHKYTNVENMDEDIKTPVMRFSPNQERKRFFRFQAFYAPFFYSIMTIYWLVGKDFIQLLRYNKKNLLAKQGLTIKKTMTQLIINKTWYLALTLVLPMIVVNLPWWQILAGFFVMQAICGLILALIFQPAHVVNETDFFVADEKGSLENSHAILQLRTTSNFARKSIFFSWFIGGLNFQIEHHLFPNICHVHYKRISGIVKETADEFNLPYHQHKTFVGALRSHFSMLNSLGTGKYDRMLAKVKA